MVFAVGEEVGAGGHIKVRRVHPDDQFREAVIGHGSLKLHPVFVPLLVPARPPRSRVVVHLVPHSPVRGGGLGIYLKQGEAISSGGGAQPHPHPTLLSPALPPPTHSYVHVHNKLQSDLVYPHSMAPIKMCSDCETTNLFSLSFSIIKPI